MSSSRESDSWSWVNFWWYKRAELTETFAGNEGLNNKKDYKNPKTQKYENSSKNIIRLSFDRYLHGFNSYDNFRHWHW